MPTNNSGDNPDFKITKGFTKKLIKSTPVVHVPSTRKGPDHQAVRLKALNQQMVKQARGLLAAIKLKDWQQFASMTSVPLLPPFSERPFSPEQAHLLLSHIEIHGTTILEGLRQQEAIEAKLETGPEYHKLTHDIKFADGSLLKVQQQKAFEAILELYLEWYKDPLNAEYSGAILPLKPGKGKSYITAALIKYLQENDLLGQSPFMRSWVLCPAGQVLMKTLDKFKQLGVQDIGSEMGHKCIISSHQSLSTNRFKNMFSDETETYYDNERIIKKFNFFPPKFCNVDESHLYKKMESSRTKYAMAWVREAETFWLFTSASWAGTLLDTKFPSCAIRPKFMGAPLTEAKFSMFINEVNGYSRAKINEPNDAAAERYRQRLKRIFITPKDDPQKVRAYNKVMVADFANEDDRAWYTQAEDRWLEAKERAGETPSALGQQMAFFTIMRQAGEACCVPIWARLIKKAWDEGKAPICGVAFQETLRDICISLVVDHGVPREKIALIWGGAEILKDEDRLTEGQIADLMIKQHEGVEELSPREKTLLKKNMVNLKGRLRMNLTEADKLKRDMYLREFGLNKQTVRERWADNQAFQKGTKEICLFTLSAGGTGIDLDHQYLLARQRVGFFTITYYGEEMLQAFGRGLRIATLTDIHQYMLFLKGTLAQQHVAPKLDRKLSSINKYATGREDYVSELMKAHIVRKPDELLYKFRTDDEIATEEPEMYGDEVKEGEEDLENGEE